MTAAVEIRYTIEPTPGASPNNSTSTWSIEDTSDGRELARIHGNAGDERALPFAAYMAGGRFIGRYATMVAAVEGIHDYADIVMRFTLVNANLYGVTQ